MLQFNQFISNQGKNYLTKEEYSARLAIFKSNYEIVKQHNKENEDFKLEINSFADLSDAEFEKKMGFKKIDNEWDDEDDEDDDGYEQAEGEEEDPELLTARLSALPTKNWVNEGAVTGVRNQGSCGGCYSFSAAAAIEGAYKIKTGKLIDMSMQQLIDFYHYTIISYI